MAASLDSILAAASETGSVVVVPGLLRWLELPETADESEETYEAYLERLTRRTP